ncbi:methylated-DNA--[protein]-cysteine S-methyltransferase [Piscinibacter aquaticus]|uniref:Methylated-DNA--protein-cysteine methyltransferase n=1 Tax=Piscinibacter aquaticus TaxID=392597 RepID=A0A5C6U0K6_9BURK|nr:methylated-DNA--[protein]-cysteine S-methyltransferase [Piscinibacter aquaticus]
MNALSQSLNERCIAQRQVDTPLGRVCIARTERGLAGLWFEGQKHHPGALDLPDRDDDPLLAEAARQLAQYFAGERRDFDLPLDLQGTPFQQSVWKALTRIPPGRTCSYGALARELGTPSAVRAVGAAVGRNPACVLVPCHRVLGQDGSLTGYAGGVERKRALLAHEARS